MGYKTYILVILFLFFSITPFVFGNITGFVSLYGAYIFLYSVMQIIMAHMNKIQCEKRNQGIVNTSLKYNILVVGYREDPKLFEQCLESVKVLSVNPKVDRVIVVIDGDLPEDYYMVDIFFKVFGVGDHLLHIDTVSNNKNICISQPHAGKRDVLYSGIKLSIKLKTFGILCTDSDTILDSKCLEALAVELEDSEDIGAVTGNVEITNYSDSVISFLSSIRYWFACNVERAYQSFNGNVMCVSGPLGVYKVSLLELFVEDWLNQEFMGSKCTYGDDRHLTNNILMLGKKVKYTHLASCKTDTPSKLSVFFRQQTRWNKSSFREVLWTMKCIDSHSILMGVDLIYQLFYSAIVLGTLIYIFVVGDYLSFIVYMLSVMLFNLLKGIYASIVTRKIVYLCYAFYGFMYISVLIPSRLYAAATMADTTWMAKNKPIYVLIFWWILLLGGISSIVVQSSYRIF